MEQYLPALTRCPLFRSLPPERVLQLCRCLHGRVRHYACGEILWTAGQPVQAAGVVLSGSLQAEQQTLTGLQVIVAHHGPGGLFGDILMSGGQQSPVTLSACEELTVLYFSVEAILGDCGKRCHCHYVLRQNLLAGISQKFWAQQKKIEYLSLPSLRQKILAYLEDRRRQTGSARVTLPGTREALAAYLCANRSALSRELGRLRDEGVIAVSGRHITLLLPAPAPQDPA